MTIHPPLPHKNYWDFILPTKIISFIYNYLEIKLYLINSQTLEIISQVESFLWLDKQGIPEKGRRIQRPKCHDSIKHYKYEDNSPKNHKQNNIHQNSFQKFGTIRFFSIITYTSSCALNYKSATDGDSDNILYFEYILCCWWIPFYYSHMYNLFHEPLE